MEALELLQLAIQAREKAYAPYSGYRVGAALLGRSGTVYLGANQENAATPAGCCAERVALYQAAMAGERAFQAVAVAGAPEGKKPDAPCFPCGICRQALSEFCGADFQIITCADTKEGFRTDTLGTLLPCAFGPQALEKGG